MYLLDTNILSRLVRKPPDPHLLEKLRQHASDRLFTSCICVMELRHGAVRRRNHGNLWRRIEREILQRVEVLGIGTEEALVAGDVLAHLWSVGRTIDVEDVLIGATALSRGLTVVTNNVAHFGRIPDLSVEDWIAD
ncbi:MAG: PIN domain-containing protein [Candidatus Methylomirabilis sp.]